MTSPITDGAPIPTTGYLAYFLARTGAFFALPVVALVPHLVRYTEADEHPTTEWEPAVLTVAGTLLPLYEAQELPPLVGGVFVGVAPAHMTPSEAQAWLETRKVATPEARPTADLADEDLVGRVTAAQLELAHRGGTW